MSYDPAGIYNLPPVYHAEPGTTIRSEQHNSPLEDIAQALSSVLVRDGRNGMIGTLQMGGYPISNVAPGTAATDAATVSQLVPIGTVVDYAGSTAPTGWLFCAGQAVSRSTYAALFAVIGTTYGNGNGSTTFNLPDLRGRVVAGRDNMGGTSAARLSSISGNTLGASGGGQQVTLTSNQIPAHTHSAGTLVNSTAGAHTHSIPSADGGGTSTNRVDTATGSISHSLLVPSAGAHTHTISGNTGSAGGGQAHPNVQPTIILNKIIKATN